MAVPCLIRAGNTAKVHKRHSTNVLAHSIMDSTLLYVCMLLGPENFQTQSTRVQWCISQNMETMLLSSFNQAPFAN